LFLSPTSLADIALPVVFPANINCISIDLRHVTYHSSSSIAQRVSKRRRVTSDHSINAPSCK
jgi:hypothetical protein